MTPPYTRCAPNQNDERQTDVQAHLHERAGNRHHGAGEDVGVRHGVVGGAETALFVLGFRQRLYDADARDVLAHRAHHAVEPLLHAAMPSNSRMGMRVHIV